jgi:TRAP transporter TAXI family solute receptor
MLRIAFALFGFALAALAGAVPARAQSIPKSLQDSGPEAVLKERKNAWVIGLAGGIVEGTYFRFAEEIHKAVEDGDEMRVLPIVSRGSASNLEDLLYLRGIDVAVTQSDVFEYFRTQRNIPNLDKRIQFILRFPTAEMHVIARADIHSLEDLRGRKVDFGAPGSSGSLTGPIVFQRLGIDVQQVMADDPGAYGPAAYQKVIKGEVDAAVRVVGKPVGHVAQIPANSGLHLLSIPFTKKFVDYYAMGEFTNADYPNLVAPGERVDTLAVPVVLAVYNWPKGSERYRKVERFVQRLFANWQKLQKPPFHPKWRDVNLAATVPGWARFDTAEQELQRLRTDDASVDRSDVARDFQAFLSRLSDRQDAPRSQAERDAMFRQFLEWRRTQGSQAR